VDLFGVSLQGQRGVPSLLCVHLDWPERREMQVWLSQLGKVVDGAKGSYHAVGGVWRRPPLLSTSTAAFLGVPAFPGDLVVEFLDHLLVCAKPGQRLIQEVPQVGIEVLLILLDGLPAALLLPLVQMEPNGFG
jgi:hypothetical protein